ncbi:hypothetical protein [Streptomyces tubbatahanensis]|uniref:hypothetical protein n=1 Tax=Streptomyces tubbatahanensis TaxID=2923272 RepID=UPI00311ACB75
MTIRRARRTVRSATLVAVAAAAAFSVTACQSGDNDASGSHKAGASAQGQAQHESASLTSKSASAARTQTLVDGSKAEVSKVGGQHYRAEIVSDGAVVATLDADGRDAGMTGTACSSL